MFSVSIFEAKTNLSKYIAALMSKKEGSIVITRSGKPVAKLIPYEADTPKRIGIAKGRIPCMPPLEDFNSISLEDDFLGNGDIL